jgi:CHAD domain-containing protein
MAISMAKSPYNIEPAAAFADAARVAFQTQARELLRNLPGTRAGDMDAVHDMRVATRRLRAAMSVFGSVFQKRKFDGLEREVAQVTDDLGAVRDLDVMIDYFSTFRDGLTEAEKVGVDALIDKLSADRERERIKLLKELIRLEKSRFAEDFEGMIGVSILPEDPSG